MQITNRDTFNISERATILEGLLEAVQDSLGSEVDAIGYQSVSVQTLAGWTGTVVFEVSNDGVNWRTKVLSAADTGSLTGSATGAGLWSGDMGARYFRTRSSVFTTGPVPVRLVFAPESLAAGSAATQAVTIANLLTAEDSVVASGASGIVSLMQRVPAAPAVQTSAVAEAAIPQVTSEGKLITSTFGAEEHLWDACVDLTLTSDVAVKASAGAGLRNVITDMTFSNAGASPVIVTIKDGATRKYARSIPAGGSVDVQLKSPIRGTAATAINAALSVAGTVTVSLSGYVGV